MSVLSAIKKHISTELKHYSLLYNFVLQNSELVSYLMKFALLFCLFPFETLDWRMCSYYILSELFVEWDPCVCRTPATMESGQKRCVGLCWDFIFLALGAGSGLLASSMGCRIRLRALINLSKDRRELEKWDTSQDFCWILCVKHIHVLWFCLWPLDGVILLCITL